MGDRTIKRAAEEYLAERLAEEGLTYEETLNRQAAVALAPAVWKWVVETITTTCDEWNKVTKDQMFSCKETVLGDIRIRCAGRPQHYDSKKRLV